MPMLLLHVGYGKTGTTTLQQAVFEPLRKAGLIHYFGMFLDAPKEHPDRRFFDELQAAMYLGDSAFENKVKGLQEDFAAAILRNEAGLPMVLSNEHFMLSSYSTRARGVTIDARKSAERLRRVFLGQDVSLLVGLRRQDAILHSFFVEAAARVHHANPEHFKSLDSYVEACLSAGSAFNSMYDFDECIEAFRTAFPDAEMSVYLFEDFVMREREVVQTVMQLAGIEDDHDQVITFPLPNYNTKEKIDQGIIVNTQPGIVAALRRIGLFEGLISVARRVMPLDRLRPKRVLPYLSDDQRQQIISAFYEANLRLGAHWPSLKPKLIAHGYSIQDGDL